MLGPRQHTHATELFVQRDMSQDFSTIAIWNNVTSDTSIATPTLSHIKDIRTSSAVAPLSAYYCCCCCDDLLFCFIGWGS